MSSATALRFVGLWLLVAVLALVPGCIKSKQSVKLAQDGKGTGSMTMTLNMAKMEQLKEMMGGMMGGEQEGGSQDDPMKDLDPEQLKAIAEANEHVRITSSSTEEDKENKTVTHKVAFEFDSLKDFYESGIASGMNVKLEKLEDGNYKFTSVMAGAGEGMPEGPEAEQQMQMFLGMMEPFLGDLEIAVSLALPTSIVETNGEKQSANEVSWTIKFADLPKAEKRTQTVTFSGAGLTWAPFEVTAAQMEEKKKAALDKSKEAEVEEPAGAGMR